MLEKLDILIKYLWLVDFTALCMLVSVALKQKVINSSLLSQALVVFLSGIVIQYKGMVNSFTDPAVSASVFNWWCIGFLVFDLAFVVLSVKGYWFIQKRFNSIYAKTLLLFSSVVLLSILYLQYGTLWGESANPSYKVWRLSAFDIGLAALYTFAIYAIRKAHDITRKQHQFLSRTCVLAFFVAAHLQLIMFLEVYLFETSGFSNIYHWGFISINLCTSAVAIVVSTLAVYQHMRKTSYEGLLWKL